MSIVLRNQWYDRSSAFMLKISQSFGLKIVGLLFNRWDKKSDMNVVTLQVNEVKIDISLSIVALLCAAMFPIKNRFTINYFCVRFNICFTSTQLKFTCSKSTIEALEKGLKYVKFLHLSLVLLLLTLYMLAG